MRWVDLPGCGHFRDVGGYRTVDGSTTKWGVLYRSASLDSLTDSGANALRELDVQTIVDLRTPDERVSPPPWNHGREVEVISMPASNPAATTLRAGFYDPGALYAAAIEARRRDFPHILSVLADQDRVPAVIACSGGKDRTGMFIALVLGVLGVPEDTIVKDYALSDEFMTRDPAAYSAALERVRAADIDPEVLRTRPETMRRFLGEVTARYGSIPAFAAESGVPDEVVAQVRVHLLERSPASATS